MKAPIQSFALYSALITVTLCGVARATESDDKATASRVRVGTFDSRLVAVAYVRSDVFHSRLEKMAAELKAAKEAGDQKRVKQLEAAGPALQHLIHKQSFGTWPIDDILKTIEGDLPKIAKESDVDVIVSKWNITFRKKHTEFIDVTMKMVERFEPTKETQKVLKDLAKKKPVPIEILEKHQH